MSVKRLKHESTVLSDKFLLYNLMDRTFHGRDHETNMTNQTAMLNVMQKYYVVGLLLYNTSTQVAETGGLHEFKANLGF